MSPIDTGRYNIVNARFLNCAVLPDANDDSDVIARSEENNPGEKWNVTLLNNKKYTIKNHGFSNFAACDIRAEKGDSIRARTRTQQWVIKESRIKGQYTISPTDADLYWALTDGEADTPVTLSPVPNDAKSQWIISKTSA